MREGVSGRRTLRFLGFFTGSASTRPSRKAMLGRGFEGEAAGLMLRSRALGPQLPQFPDRVNRPANDVYPGCSRLQVVRNTLRVGDVNCKGGVLRAGSSFDQD